MVRQVPLGNLVNPADPFQSIMEYNGGSVVAMIGKDCVAIASDLRLGAQSIGVAMNFEKVSCGLNIIVPDKLIKSGLPSQRQAILWTTRISH
jgi:hypothetical protein